MDSAYSCTPECSHTQPNQTPYADLLAHTVDYFHTLGSKSAPATTSDIASIAEILAANLVSYFEDVFEVEVEDGSPYQMLERSR
ncbi:hypothetical protein BASA83_012980 [Batrachochytrium salamandrivorans]|nr:hypothetical protein BASA83_012980 [Batrachochytrium salamandrivorans]